MTGFAASLPSPRSSKPLELASHSSHSQARPHQPGPMPAQLTYGFQPSGAATAVPSLATPAPDRPAVQSASTASPAGYFSLVLDPNDQLHGQHSKKNWSPASSSIRSAAARSPRPVQIDNPSTPFQKQAEVLSLSLSRPAIPPDSRLTAVDQGPRSSVEGPLDYFSTPQTASPAPLNGSEQPCENSWPSLSAPPSLHPSPQLKSPHTLAHIRKTHGRSSTLPNPLKEGEPGLITPTHLAELLSGAQRNRLLLLDVRTYKLYAESRIKTAVNLCIPTTLLKRPSFNVAKLSETFANVKDKDKFGRWKEMEFIVVYDVESKDSGETSALAAVHTLSKFSREGWKGKAFILKGGFSDFASIHPDKVDRSPITGSSSSPKGLSLAGSSASLERGGVFNCPLPAQQSIVNPFFSNIRQNMDLIDGVGEIPIHLPQTMGREDVAALPAWLKEVSQEGGSKVVADRFYKIEKAEQRRMQGALNIAVTYSPRSTTMKPGHTLAGVEKGAKNRYNNIWPYDHARVKLQEYPHEECDYVNASYVCAPHSQKRYIASQAPLPSTFRDFWSMVWEQDVRVIVMLTAEQEGGQVKSHKYWESNEYGRLRLTRIQERKVSLEPSSLKTSPKRRSVSSSTQPSSADPNVPYIIVRKFTLEHTGHPFSPIREITQLQYSSWPDFGTPAHPAHVLGLVEHTEAVVRSAHAPSSSSQFSSDASPGRRPVLVHCSAGCGRTGTFCTIDSVIAMMRRQRIRRRRHAQDDGSDGDGNMKMKKLDLDDEDDEWISRDDEDLVFKAVSEFRDQRISMVQSLQQYVLCYETVLEWLGRQSPLDSGKRKA